ncbi:GGDEF domain-containing protein [Actinoplanes oblitus]|uniref:GGDEF domain-containing protein n=1 Tax=Actinoplanes oblitus TaxID=3040509 RepID=A0ABY8WQ45_9ACTN|nr:GGDEF domain-containing protein [Actinoplanes oblitus]WIM99773.1 GGDEF domain-containing protein [Actinoplanes oblitus]
MAGRRLPLWIGPLLLAPVLTTAYYVAGHFAGGFAAVTQLLYSSASLTAVAGLVRGALRYRPRGARRPWLLLAAGQGSMLIGDLVYFVLGRSGEVPYPSVADLWYLGGSLGFTLGLLSLVRRRTPEWDLPSLLDATVVAVAVSLLGWVYLIHPLSAGATGPAQAATVAFPVMDLMLLSVGVRLMIGAGTRPRAFWLVMLWLVGVLIGDTTYAVQALLGTYDGVFVDGVWMCAVLCLAAAGLHPSMATVDEPSPAAAPDATRTRLAILAVASVVAPVTLGVQYLRGAALHVPEVTVACVVLFLLVLARMAGLVGVQRTMAITDGLTGLRTRRYLEEALRTEADRCRRTGASLAFVLVDVDHFKRVNDTYGHQAGDRVLVEVARRMRQVVRTGDVVARYGGEEFAVLLPGADPRSVAAIAGSIHRGVSTAPFAVGDDQLLSVTISVGVACLPDDTHEVAELTRIADQALYAAKASGRNRVVLAGTDPLPAAA